MSTATETNDQVTPEDALGMSDEAFASMDPSAFELPDEDTQEEEDTRETSDEADEDTGDDDSGEDGSAPAESDDQADDGDGATDEDAADDEDTDTADEEDGADSDDESTEEDGEEDSDGDSEEKDKDTEEDETEVDYKAEYDRLMAPFRANGREMKVDNVDEAIQLMQMGANYNKKMAALKPSLKTLKTLEKHSLLDENKLNHLIDLSKGDKGAIQKLLKDAGVDPLDLEAGEESDYKPNSYTADDREVELDSVLEDLQDTPTYHQTIDVVSNKWDERSQQTVADNPQLLNVINDHMASGIYERVSSEVEKQRALGRLNGLSDIEAYKQIGDQLHKQGKFNDLANTGQDQQEQPAVKKVVSRKKPKTSDPAVKQKKRAASSTRSKPAGNQQAADFNPLSMSDEEFEKQVNEHLL